MYRERFILTLVIIFSSVVCQSTPSVPSRMSLSSFVYDASYDTLGRRVWNEGHMIPTIESFNDDACGSVNRTCSISSLPHCSRLYIYSFSTALECVSDDPPSKHGCDPSNIAFSPPIAYLSFNWISNLRIYKTILSSSFNSFNNYSYYIIIDGVTSLTNSEADLENLVFPSDGYSDDFQFLDLLSEQQIDNLVLAMIQLIFNNNTNSLVDGIVFDIEPLSIHTEPWRSGQRLFYEAFAKFLPTGKTFGVFGDKDFPLLLQQMFNTYGNGYYILSLYDLSGGPLIRSVPSQYVLDAYHTIITFMNITAPFRLAIPAAASSTQFSYCLIPSSMVSNESSEASSNDCVSMPPRDPPSQLDYISLLLNMMTSVQLKSYTYFNGLDLWLMESEERFQGYTLVPSSPQSDVTQAIRQWMNDE